MIISVETFLGYARVVRLGKLHVSFYSEFHASNIGVNVHSIYTCIIKENPYEYNYK